MWLFEEYVATNLILSIMELAFFTPFVVTPFIVEKINLINFKIK